MAEITSETLGRKDIFHSVVSRLPPWDAVAYMCTCKRLKKLGIEWLKLHGRGWLPQIDGSWTWKELRLAALWAFGKPKWIHRQILPEGVDAEMSRRAIWKVFQRTVSIQSVGGNEVIVRIPGENVSGTPSITVYECESQTVGIVSANGKLGLIPESNPRWISLCNQPAYYMVNSRTEAKWVVRTLRNQKGIAFSWTNLSEVLTQGEAVWQTVKVPSKLIGNANVVPDVCFQAPDRLAVLTRDLQRVEAALLDLTTSRWYKGRKGKNYPIWPRFAGRVVSIGKHEIYQLDSVEARLSFRLKDDQFNPVIRTFSGECAPMMVGVEKLRQVLSQNGALVFLQRGSWAGFGASREIVLLHLQPVADPPSLDSAIRSSARLSMIAECITTAIVHDRQVIASLKRLPIYPSKPLDGRFQRRLTLAIFAGRPDILKLLVQRFVLAKEAIHSGFSLRNAFSIACSLNAEECAFALLNSGALPWPIAPLGQQKLAASERVEQWPLSAGIESAALRGHWRLIRRVLNLLRAPCEANDLARIATLDWLSHAFKRIPRGNIQEARELLFEMIMQQPSLLRADTTIALIRKLALWQGGWGELYPIDLATQWDEDQLEWEKLCKKQESVCWRLVVELRAGRRYSELRLLFNLWLNSPLAPGTKKALRSLVKLNPAARKRCKR